MCSAAKYVAQEQRGTTVRCLQAPASLLALAPISVLPFYTNPSQPGWGERQSGLFREHIGP